MKLEQLKAAVRKEAAPSTCTQLALVPRRDEVDDRVGYPHARGGGGRMGKHVVLVDNEDGLAEYAYMDENGCIQTCRD